MAVEGVGLRTWLLRVWDKDMVVEGVGLRTWLLKKQRVEDGVGLELAIEG